MGREMRRAYTPRPISYIESRSGICFQYGGVHLVDGELGPGWTMESLIEETIIS